MKRKLKMAETIKRSEGEKIPEKHPTPKKEKLVTSQTIKDQKWTNV